jgi:HEAT repeat protein
MATKDIINWLLDLYNLAPSELDENQVRMLNEYSQFKQIIVRCSVAEVLSEYKERKYVGLLIWLANDSNSLVRICAVDSLREYLFNEVYIKLKDMCENDLNRLTRAHSTYSLCRVGIGIGISKDEMLNFFKQRLTIEKNEYCKLYLYASLYLLGQNDKINDVLKVFKSKNYRVRCSVINLLYDLLNEKNSDLIKTFINDNVSNELTIAVKRDMEQMIKFLEPVHTNVMPP